MYVSNHRVSFLYFYINMIPFIYLFLGGFRFAYVIGFGIFFGHYLMLGSPFPFSLLMRHSLNSIPLDLLDTILWAGGQEWVGARLHDDFSTLFHTRAARVCHRIISGFSLLCFPQKAHCLKTIAATKIIGFRWPWKTPGSTSELGNVALNPVEHNVHAI